MTYRIEFTPTARRDLHRLPTRAAFAVVEYLEGPLAGNPHREGKPLRDDPTERCTARVGVHRILYLIDEKILVISVVRIAHRADVYRR
ncbi:MAG TPA: type II toxin-antitoxin system RelE/ParE family toxin [Pseudonocardiaceae bacterium]|nr:type II toxin-antitoxin system RelE/ParE family toxin [Pseudonocardiaceae bacterium]